MSLEDIEAIRATLTKYCMAADTADADQWVAQFTDDAVLDLGPIAPKLQGREQLQKFAASLTGGSMHLAANMVIDIDGDQATATSYLVLIAGREDPKVRLAGRYDDELRRVDGTWRIAQRRLDARFRATA